ncbi:MAG: hypothetical protein NDI61_00715 [Bdellovibrionaceae bacterium]|nr:hypothetical protein [Pseudobdellovibrionaceae bacterium]
MSGQRGAGLIHLIVAIAGTALLLQLFLLGMMQNEVENTRRDQVREMKIHLLNSMLDTIRDEMTLRNSRIDVNSILIDCMGGTGTCDERQLYDFVIYSPTPPYIFSGQWPPAPPGLKILMGGFSANKQFYNVGGGRCIDGATEMTASCPLQGIGRIRPLCGGTFDTPALSIPGGAVCATPATGFEVVIGVASYWNGTITFNPDTLVGDQRVFRVSARTFLN